MREKRIFWAKGQIKDERTFFSRVEKSLQEKGFEVIETLPRRTHHQERQLDFRIY